MFPSVLDIELNHHSSAMVNDIWPTAILTWKPPWLITWSRKGRYFYAYLFSS